MLALYVANLSFLFSVLHGSLNSASNEFWMQIRESLLEHCRTFGIPPKQANKQTHISCGTKTGLGISTSGSLTGKNMFNPGYVIEGGCGKGSLCLVDMLVTRMLNQAQDTHKLSDDRMLSSPMVYMISFDYSW